MTLVPEFKTHFDLSRASWANRVAAGEYKIAFDGFSFFELPKTYDEFRPRLEEVGEEWGWPDMDDRFSEEAMAPVLVHPETRLRALTVDGKEVGYTLIVKPSDGITKRFWGASNDGKVIEIENIGLKPEHCGDKKGGRFLQQQWANLFDLGYERVYLSTSSTNHPHLPRWYSETMRMRWITRDTAAKPAA